MGEIVKYWWHLISYQFILYCILFSWWIVCVCANRYFWACCDFYPPIFLLSEIRTSIVYTHQEMFKFTHEFLIFMCVYRTVLFFFAFLPVLWFPSPHSNILLSVYLLLYLRVVCVCCVSVCHAQVYHMFAGSARVAGWAPASWEWGPGQANIWFDQQQDLNRRRQRWRQGGDADLVSCRLEQYAIHTHRMGFLTYH